MSSSSSKSNYESILPQVEGEKVDIDPLTPPATVASRRSLYKKIGLAVLVVSAVVIISVGLMGQSGPPAPMMEGAGWEPSTPAMPAMGGPPMPSPEEMEATWAWWEDIRKGVSSAYHSAANAVSNAASSTVSAVKKGVTEAKEAYNNGVTEAKEEYKEYQESAVGPMSGDSTRPSPWEMDIEKKMAKKEEDGGTDMIYMNHVDGMDILVTAYGDSDQGASSKDYFLLIQGVDTPINQVYSGVATSSAILNSYRGMSGMNLPVDPYYHPYPFATQTDIFNECTNQNAVIKNSTFDGIQVPPGGLVLGQVKNMMECNLPHEKAWSVDVTYVDPSKVSVDDMRQQILDALEHPGKRVIVHYDRSEVGQQGGAHFSPVGAYSKDKDAFLIVDVSQYKYPDAWVPAKRLYDAMSTADICGTWNYPQAQEDLSPESLFTHDKVTYLKALKTLGCRPEHRGYMVVTVGEGED
eukprot:CAMPEP_0116842086 /NCGR_PEP_ID=MMETSP0418-20121206/11311_1 /TAXON_ID=1158023 /ORGANISM="Astrosyne radiata, Strain 13vi08-1A" /LENGTH=464 /DNA_ID=CAMNT_0004472637 /DNA_START=49 /DNA_END=1443 /DNA_ORIENTATION=-